MRTRAFVLTFVIVASLARDAAAGITIISPSVGTNYNKNSSISVTGSAVANHRIRVRFRENVVDDPDIYQEMTVMSAMGTGGFTALLTPPQGGWPVGDNWLIEAHDVDNEETAAVAVDVTE